MSTWRPYKIQDLAQLVTARDVEILESLERYRLLDSRLIQELHFPVGSPGHATVAAATRAANRVLTRLEGHQFIGRLVRRMGGSAHGSSAIVWQLAASGERFLRARRGDPNRRRFIEPTAGFLEHTLEVAKVAARVLGASRAGNFDVLSLETEPVCWRSFQAGDGSVTLKPDLYVVTADPEIETHSFIEVDRGTEHLPAVLRKCHVYQRYWRTGTEQAALDIYPAVIWATTDERRAQRIQEAIAADKNLTTDLFRTTTHNGVLRHIAPSHPTNRRGEDQ